MPLPSAFPARRVTDDTPERRTAEAPISLGDEDWGTDAEPLEDVMLERALIARAARALDARQRRILLLRFFLDRTQEEVADELGISQAHVSRLLDDALRRMRRRLERDEPLMPEKQRARVGSDWPRIRIHSRRVTLPQRRLLLRLPKLHAQLATEYQHKGVSTSIE